MSEEMYVETEYGLAVGASDRERRAFEQALERSKMRREAVLSKKARAKNEKWVCSGGGGDKLSGRKRQVLLCKSGSENRLAVQLEREVYDGGGEASSGMALTAAKADQEHGL
jgi:hypothetical protein